MPEKIRQPRQPIVWDKHGVIRFKENAIVRFIVDWCAAKNGGVGYEDIDHEGPAPDLNEIMLRKFSNEDRMQLAQLIGYSVSGFGSLSYVSRREASECDSIAEQMAAKRKRNRAALKGEAAK